MFSTLLLSLVPTLAPAPVAAAPLVMQEEGGDEVQATIAAAGDDIAALEALAAAFKEADDDASARLVFERILEVDGEHAAAHKALRHHNYDGKWFKSYAALSKYRREEAKRMLEEEGKVRYNDEWVLQVDLPYLRMGWVKNDGGDWVNPAKLEREKQIAAYVAEGRKQRDEDGEWIAEADFDKWTQGLYKVGDEWVTKAEANAHHAELGNWWKYQGKHFIAYSTCDVDSSVYVAWWADKTYDDLVRIYGVEPDEKPIFACLNKLTQYNAFAAGDQAAGLPPMETGGFSSFHFAFFGDVWFDVSNPQAPEYIGGGVAYLDIDDAAMQPWGQFSVRHAAGLSFAENIDRSWNTVSQFLSNQGGGQSPDALWEEKVIPRWMIYGAASYVERFMVNDNPEDPWGWRNWSLDMLNEERYNDLADIFAFTLDINDLAGSERLIKESGAVVAFIVDGKCAPVTAAHAEFTAAMKKGEGAREAAAKIQEAVIANQEAFVAFTGAKFGRAEAAAAAAAAAAEAAASQPTDAAGTADGATDAGTEGASGAQSGSGH